MSRGPQHTGRMRQAIMSRYSVIPTKHGKKRVMIPVPPSSIREEIKDQPANFLMRKWEEITGYSAESIALMDRRALVALDFKHRDELDFTSWHDTLTWADELNLHWNIYTLPNCTACPFENLSCSNPIPRFKCRVLNMAQQTHFTPNVYWNRTIGK